MTLSIVLVFHSRSLVKANKNFGKIQLGTYPLDFQLKVSKIAVELAQLVKMFIVQLHIRRITKKHKSHKES